MKTLSTLCLTLALLLSFAVVGCDQSADTATAPEPAAPTADAAAQAETTDADADVTADAAADAQGDSIVPADYPLDVCLVSGEALGSMGDPIKVTHNGRDVYLCCNGCVDTFNENAEQYMAKLDAAASSADETATP